MSQKSPPAPSRKPPLDGTWVNPAKLNARSAKTNNDWKNNSNASSFGKSIAVLSLTTISLWLYWHSIRSNKQQCFHAGAGIAVFFFTSYFLLLHWHSIWFCPSMNRQEPVFGRAREGAFDAKASSRINSVPSLVFGGGAGEPFLASKVVPPQLLSPVRVPPCHPPLAGREYLRKKSHRSS